MKNLIGALAVVAVLVVGCGSPGTQAVAESSAGPTASKTPSASPTPTAPAASKADYGRVALKVQADVDKYVADWKKNTCSGGSVGQGDPLCFTIAMRAESVAQIVGLSLKNAQQPKSPDYIGAPPSDLVKIIATTTAASDKAVAAGKEWRAANCPTGYGCTNKTLMLDTAMTDLQTELDAWRLYLK